MAAFITSVIVVSCNKPNKPEPSFVPSAIVSKAVVPVKGDPLFEGCSVSEIQIYFAEHFREDALIAKCPGVTESLTWQSGKQTQSSLIIQEGKSK